MNLPLSEALSRAESHLRAGRHREAEAICRAVIEAAPDQATAYLLLAAALRAQGQTAVAQEVCRRAVELCPTSVEAWNNMSAILAAEGRLADAERAAQQAVTLGTQEPVAWYNLGHALHLQDRLGEAEVAYGRALQLSPSYAKADYNRSIVLARLGRFDEAEAGYRRLLAADPGHVSAANNLGNLLLGKGRAGEAEAYYRQALVSSPDHLAARTNLSMAFLGLGRLGEAEQRLVEVLRDHPQSVEAAVALGKVYMAEGRIAEAEDVLARAAAARPDSPDLGSVLLLCQQYRPGITVEALAASHRQWAERHATPRKADWRPHENTPDPRRRLRLGFVSADLADHPVGHLVVGVLEALAGRADTFCYYDRVRRDAMVTRCQAAAGAWRSVAGWNDAQLARQIRDDRIDVLVDLGGHSGDQRLTVFARKPAPIQLTWLGYPGTTGMDAMDGILADRFQIPEADEPYYAERVLRLPDSYTALRPPVDLPPTGPLPAVSTGRITLGCLGNPAKINGQVVALWARILRQLPDAKLLLKYHGLGDPATAGRYREQFAAEGIAAERVELQGASPRAEALAAYNRVDIGLDTFPYSGGLTTFEALWMGVPVVTWPGKTFAGRHALSYLSTAGLEELVAGDESDYVRRVVDLANDRARLAALRESLRGRLAGSPLCDPERLAGHLLGLLGDLWREWCASRPSPSAENPETA